MPAAGMAMSCIDTPDCGGTPVVTAQSELLFGDTGGIWRGLRVDTTTDIDDAVSVRVS